MAEIVQSQHGVTLVGGGELTAEALERALALAPVLVAADSGADRALTLGHMPQAVIGDFDSLGLAARADVPAERLHHIAEQATTDFDKALRHIAAPFVLAVGFTGARLDHTLAAFNTLARHPARRCLVLGAHDLAFLAPPELELALPPGTRVSLFPMAELRGRSQGLRWPIDGIDFAPGGFAGISNVAGKGRVRLEFEAPGMLVILPAAHLSPALSALVPGALPESGN